MSTRPADFWTANSRRKRLTIRENCGCAKTAWKVLHSRPSLLKLTDHYAPKQHHQVRYSIATVN
eukprot:2552003-Pyramimonas_sp.AAC.1